MGERQRANRAVRWVLAGLLILALLSLSLTALLPWYLSRPRAIPSATPTSVADLAGDPFVSAAPIPPRPAHRSGAAQPLVSAVFGATDATRKMDLPGLPFTFLTPSSWGCLTGSVTVSAQAWRCIDEHAGTDRPQLDIVVRHCAAACTEAQRAELDTLLTHPATYQVRDTATRYAERVVDGRYVLTLNRVFTVVARGAADWQLLVEAEAAPGDAATVQKIVNDVWSQTL
jgi:hypothetical protein